LNTDFQPFGPNNLSHQMTGTLEAKTQSSAPHKQASLSPSI
jgi:hypothetical protein